VDLAEVAYAAAALDADLSDQATIELESAPTSMVSLYHTNSIAYILSRYANWSVVRSGAVAYMVINAGSPA